MKESGHELDEGFGAIEGVGWAIIASIPLWGFIIYGIRGLWRMLHP